MTAVHRSFASIAGTLACALTVLAAPAVQAATFRTFLNDPSGMAAAMGPRSTQTTETFAGVVDGKLLTATPDPWNSFTIELVGTGTSPSRPDFIASRYCANLSAPSCIYWNANATQVPGVFGVFDSPGTGVSIKLSSPTIAGFSFSFTDWNDPSDGTGAVMEERSYFEVFASDGSMVEIHGAPQLPNAPPQTFGVALSAADIAAGVYLREIRWVGVPGAPPEVVGFYHFATFTNPVLVPPPIEAIPTLSAPGLLLLSASMAGIFLFLRRRWR
ncbi:hypothetical protein [Pseudorhodoferax sp.]|uniref:hypothetical protein n=1 Tax=Pseudorhodoferax sp. TaxID=1993553 RepID=UPI002DD6AA32|nr:hypothetical protein [Pseudorhodoferax sp.]